MEEKANIYQRGKIYKIVSDQTDKIYIGSTTLKYLCARMNQHRMDFKKKEQNKINGHYCSSSEILKFGDAKIILIETYPCNSKDELHAKEQYYIDLNKAICVNILKAYDKDTHGKNKSDKDKIYYQRNKEEISEHHKKYYHTHRTEILKTIICECGKTYIKNKRRHELSKKHIDFKKLVFN